MCRESRPSVAIILTVPTLFFLIMPIWELRLYILVMDDLTLLSEAVIYCNSSKTGLKIASHDPNFIENQNNIIDGF